MIDQKKPKVYTITLSPAIDYILKLDQLVLNTTNRPTATDMYAAGKGVHVSMMLNNLQVDNEAIIFTNGDFQSFFLSDLQQNQVKYKNFNNQGQIRINLKLIDDHQTEVSVASSPIASTEFTKLINYLDQVLQPNDIVVLTGSKPSNLSDDDYVKICQITKKKQAKCIVDAFGSALLTALNSKPWLIKPNLHELEITFNQKITNYQELKMIGEKLVTMGATNVLISMGQDGAILINNQQILRLKLPKIDHPDLKLINSAGAGDSMLGGFIAEYLKTQDLKQALKMSCLCGTATAFSLRIADRAKITQIKPYFDGVVLKK